MTTEAVPEGAATIFEAVPVGAKARGGTRRFEQKRDELVAAATEILNERGLKGFTLAEVAKKTGLITQGVAYYFPKKDDLATACILRTIERFEAVIEAALAHDTAEARISAFLRDYVTLVGDVHIRGTPPLATFAEVRSLNEPNFSEALNAITSMFRRMRKLFDTPELAWMDRPTQIARTVLLLQVALSFGSWSGSSEAADYDRSYERTRDILFRGVVGSDGVCWSPLPLPTITPPDKSSAREAFLIAATQLINEEGYRGASVEKISARLNVSKGAFYHHNDAKDDMVVRCFERTIAILTQVQMAVAKPDANHWQQLVTACTALAEFQRSSRGPLLRSAAIYALPPGAAPRIQHEWDLVTHRFSGMISDGIVDGSIRPIDARIGGEIVMVAINSAAELPAWLPDVGQSEVADLYVRPALCGLLSP
jgi:AcrR family transcriptional regulator